MKLLFVVLALIVLLLFLGIVALVHRGKFPRCIVFGHDDRLKLEPCRISLECVTCGNESDGWSLALPPPPMRAKVIRFRKRLRLAA